MFDGTGLVEVMLGLDGFRVLDVVEDDGELMVTVETKLSVVGCEVCGVRAEPQDRMAVTYRDFGVFRAAGPVGVGQTPVAVP